MKILIAGGSFTGQYLLRTFPEHSVCFLTRRESVILSEGGRLHQKGSHYDLILDTVSASGTRHPYADEISAAAPGAAIVHVSSTSVFPEGFSAARGDLLPVFDESTVPVPESDGGRARWSLERAIQSAYPEAIILRCGGIYGPGRSLIGQFKRGDFGRTGTGNRMVSRIHVHDLCRLAVAIAERKRQGAVVPRVIHGVDPTPALNAEVFAFCEASLGIQVPGAWRDAQPSGRAIRSLYATELIRFRYPSFREGFLAALAAESPNA